MGAGISGTGGQFLAEANYAYAPGLLVRAGSAPVGAPALFSDLYRSLSPLRSPLPQEA